jgi:methylphosphonate synthase
MSLDHIGIDLQLGWFRNLMNGWKRTLASVAKDIQWSSDDMKRIFQGKTDIEELQALAVAMSRVYPTTLEKLLLPSDDTRNGVLIMRAQDSQASSRIYERLNGLNETVPYYEYRDTAMSVLSPIKPEWIKEEVTIDDTDPDNPHVVYNKGHFEHQMTFFIGPVNFYYQVGGTSYMAEMNTGDSNYITPFNPHSFTSRDADRLGLIIAVTFEGDVARAQKEMYLLGRERGADRFYLDASNGARAQIKLLHQHMRTEYLQPQDLPALLQGTGITAEDILDETRPFSQEERAVLAEKLHIEPKDLLVSEYDEKAQVLVQRHDPAIARAYPNSDTPQYLIHPLVRSPWMPHMNEPDLETGFESPLHQYLFNYGDTPIDIAWTVDGHTHQDTLGPQDSVYLQPWIRTAFGQADQESGQLLILGVSGAINSSVQHELSRMPDIKRVSKETTGWF